MRNNVALKGKVLNLELNVWVLSDKFGYFKAIIKTWTTTIPILLIGQFAASLRKFFLFILILLVLISVENPRVFNKVAHLLFCIVVSLMKSRAQGPTFPSLWAYTQIALLFSSVSASVFPEVHTSTSQSLQFDDLDLRSNSSGPLNYSRLAFSALEFSYFLFI